MFYLLIFGVPTYKNINFETMFNQYYQKYCKLSNNNNTIYINLNNTNSLHI